MPAPALHPPLLPDYARPSSCAELAPAPAPRSCVAPARASAPSLPERLRGARLSLVAPPAAAAAAPVPDFMRLPRSSNRCRLLGLATESPTRDRI
ncbi:hypothetical protein PR202_gb27347 [Eleusine coracana subsp. coracana]|uniref:Uncharacterized protein n=1 Tax=Eleusine coracana subsp. coracana TaxID=191504 RepID=A0AAV5FU93_ELECO|nr:hypothetical protein PR202_gb27347 [Eleusine coracana subsp. coracana]